MSQDINELIKQEVSNIKNELFQYIKELEQKNKLLEETIEQIKLKDIDEKITTLTKNEINKIHFEMIKTNGMFLS